MLNVECCARLVETLAKARMLNGEWIILLSQNPHYAHH